MNGRLRLRDFGLVSAFQLAGPFSNPVTAPTFPNRAVEFRLIVRPELGFAPRRGNPRDANFNPPPFRPDGSSPDGPNSAPALAARMPPPRRRIRSRGGHVVPAPGPDRGGGHAANGRMAVALSGRPRSPRGVPSAAAPAPGSAGRPASIGGMTAVPFATGLGLPAAGAMSPLERGGYRAGAVVSPDPLVPGDRLAGIRGEDEPAFDDPGRVRSVAAAELDRAHAIAAAPDAGFAQREAREPVACRPLSMAGGGKPGHDVVRSGMRGFGKALAPRGRLALAEDARPEPRPSPLVAFSAFEGPGFE